MKPEPNTRLDAYRRAHPTIGDSPAGANFGWFVAGPLRILSSGSGNGGEWEHVSVSCATRCPTWDEMAWVARLFWEDSETLLMFRPPKSQYVNYHPYTLHWWKQTGAEVELPPTELIGPVGSRAKGVR